MAEKRNPSYNIPVEAGTYLINLHFAEIYFSSTGARVFDVDVEGGQAKLNSLDVVSEVGAKTALVKTIKGIYVNDGTLDINFKNLVNNAKISAIEVILIYTDGSFTL